MNILLRAITVILGVFCSIAIASGTTALAENSNTQLSLVFQVNQSQMKFDSSTVESANLVDTVPIRRPFYGLKLKLKAGAAKKFRELTGQNIGKQANIMLNGRVVSSPVIQSELGNEFLFSGLTKEEVEQFIKSLKK